MSALRILIGVYPMISTVLVVILLGRKLVFSKNRTMSQDDIRGMAGIAFLWPFLIFLFPWHLGKFAFQRFANRRNGAGQ